MDYVPVDYFEVAMEHVFHWEGGYVNDPRDPGGETKYGISKRAYPTVDIANLTKAQAREIYRRDYWEACRCGELPGPLALMVFDSAVNQGQGRAKRLLQASLGVKQDGIVGPMTLGAAHEAPLNVVMLQYSVRRALHYVNLSTFKHFGKGWLSRLFDTHGTAMTAYVQEARLQERVP
ncbi:MULTISPECIES: glycoside hydrolase family 108 protein [unclassified Marinobacter]|uniref:glycoside hydrolase family 108 protein n=1 Tax=unclassified Marinobacter TaxID=83889 RepID=UPI0012AA6865|nr:MULTISPECIES: glycosyl hydrolase 108 family protein [unclassified Marinobacter]QFS87582.1 putative Peptidoglycan domain protein [Marinobacter sp. THAF197a]QFT51367.1 putative Peptidoglycan domain protein [Marinobacter sp. THAF39]